MHTADLAGPHEWKPSGPSCPALTPYSRRGHQGQIHMQKPWPKPHPLWMAKPSFPSTLWHFPCISMYHGWDALFRFQPGHLSPPGCEENEPGWRQPWAPTVSPALTCKFAQGGNTWVGISFSDPAGARGWFLTRKVVVVVAVVVWTARAGCHTVTSEPLPKAWIAFSAVKQEKIQFQSQAANVPDKLHKARQAA